MTNLVGRRSAQIVGRTHRSDCAKIAKINDHTVNIRRHAGRCAVTQNAASDGTNEDIEVFCGVPRGNSTVGGLFYVVIFAPRGHA